ncbi:MAG: beta-lactamase family protein [Bacteroidales bacterium]|nr:beta-lactamase family protein [Bacteroidales bacterium]
MKKYLIILVAALVAACGPKAVDKLEREEASPELKAGLAEFIDSVKATLTPPIDWRTMVNVHSIMVVKDGKILTEQYFGDWNADRPHAMFSVSKTFTATAVGIAIHEGKMALTDKVADYFPDKQVEGNPCTATVEDLLMMAGGHDTDPTMQILEFDRTRFVSYIKEGAEVADAFFNHPFIHKPGSYFVYNSLGTYLLSAIVTKVTGESVLDYLTPRLFDPLGIEKPYWEADKYGITAGGWGLELKTEDMARMGQLLLQKGKWGRKQLIPAEWVEAMSAKHVECAPAGVRIEDSEKVTGVPDELNDWRQGYCYQMWRGTHGSFRADGAGGQYILLMPDKNAVVILTSWSSDLQRELNFVWKYIYANL